MSGLLLTLPTQLFFFLFSFTYGSPRSSLLCCDFSAFVIVLDARILVQLEIKFQEYQFILLVL